MAKKKKIKRKNPHKMDSENREDWLTIKRRKDAEKAIRAWNKKQRKKKK